MTDPAPSVGRRRVLIVDNDPSFGQSLEQDFRARAFDVETAASIDEAIARVAATPPELLVLHLSLLPDSDAIDLLRRWKTEAPAMVVIVLSDNVSLNRVVAALNEGARRFFTKRVSAAALLAELEERRSTQPPTLPPSLIPNHQLSTTALDAEGIDRFFAISPGLLSIAGFDGFFKMLNPEWEKTLGYSIDELCARPYLELVHPEDRDKATDEALEISHGQTVFRFKNRYRCKDGSYRWLAWSATPSPAHRLVYASARDVTKSVWMEQGLRRSNEQLNRMAAKREVLLRDCAARNDDLVELGRVKDEISAMIVHDLKNPLSVIVSNYDYILEGFEGSVGCLDALRDSQSAGRRMLRLLTNLVDVARIENSALDVRASELTLSQLLRLIADQRRVLAGTRTVSIVVMPAPEVTVTVDADLLTRTVENIFDNALRYTPRGGLIEVELRELPSHVEIRIGNSGRAIPVEERQKIFDKYSQSSSNVGHLNLGLGLYFCRLAIEAQGGTIWVEETERLPTIFAIRLPRLVESASRRAPTETSITTPA